MKRQLSILSVTIFLIQNSTQLTLAKEFIEEEEYSSTYQINRINPKNFTPHIGFKGLEELREKKLIQINSKWYIPKKEKEFEDILCRFIHLCSEPDRFIDAYVIEDLSTQCTVLIEWFGWDPEEKLHYLIWAADFTIINVEQ